MRAADFDIAGKVVVITGASAGIGKMLAEGLSDVGAEVVAAARRTDVLEDLMGDGITKVRCDVIEPDDRRHLIEATVRKHGRVDALVNNAGIASKGVPALRETAEDFQRILEVDLVAPFELSKLCVWAFREQGSGGSIVNVTSTSAILSSASILPQAAYCAAKGGLAQLTRELAAQWGRYGVRVNSFAPGLFNTEMTHSMFDAHDGPGFEARNRHKARTPIKQDPDASDACGIVQYLISDASKFVTGQQIAVDGGLT